MTIREELQKEKQKKFDNPYETEGYRNGIEVAEYICKEIIDKSEQKKPVIGDTFSEGFKKALLRAGQDEAANWQSWCCPNCEKSLIGLKEKRMTHRHIAYCPDCGQSLDWNNTF